MINDSENKRRILLVSCEGLGNGGVQALMMGIVRSLHKKYIFDILLFTSQKRFYDDEFLSYGGNILRIPRYEGKSCIVKKIDYYLRGMSLYKKTLHLLKQNNTYYDAIHCNDEFESAVILKAAYNYGIPIRIMHTHTIAGGENIIAKCLHAYRKIKIEKYSTIKIACSKESGLSFYLNKNGFEIINNFYDDEKFNESKFSSTKINGLKILQVGRLSEIKNQLFTIDIINEIRKSESDVVLYLLGDDENGYVRKISEKITQTELKDNVVLLPGKTNVADILNQVTCAILPSLSEGFGIFLIEAQAMGVRCYASNNVPVLTNLGGVKYLDISMNAEKWARVILNDYHYYGNKRNKYNIKEFSQSAVMNKYNELYSGSILENKW